MRDLTVWNKLKTTILIKKTQNEELNEIIRVILISIHPLPYY